ncbi:AAA family ATPase [Sorangium sp. So ce1504]|uniref:AAA family ATPase n=1 Tax=Sorangium sp. So ce1504 TaxID=3133337 RepID=UPI003F5E4C89
MAKDERTKKASPQSKPAPPAAGISAVAVEGYKSLRQRTEVAIRPLTLLAGANSSGKSSVMQAPLLLKQTLEAPYDPGALLLDGPHVRFTAADQLLSRSGKRRLADCFAVTVAVSDGAEVTVHFEQQPGMGFDVTEMSAARPGEPLVTIRPGMSREKIVDVLPANQKKIKEILERSFQYIAVGRERCFLVVEAFEKGRGESMAGIWRNPLHPVAEQVLGIVHVPALRGNPTRTYKTTAVGTDFPGTFEPYVASIIHQWQVAKDVRQKQLGAALEKLGLTWKVETARVDDTQVELRVGRLRRAGRGGVEDLVSIADVGFGLSQCLPVIVALLAARPGKLVYLEEPEIHLHPRAQVALAQILADAALRGVRVVVETHSSLLLLGVQSLVAEGALSPELVALHWFSQNDDGATEVRSAGLDDAGAFGDWPEDFADVTLAAQSRYLDAAEARVARR